MNLVFSPAQQRKMIYLAARRCHTAHLASSFSSVEILTALYQGGVLRVDPVNPSWPQRDRFILSKGHASLALYVNLVARGFLPEEELRTFCQPGSRLGGEPCAEIPGVEATTGSLGHGLGVGLGMALALKAQQSDARVYVLVGDGECEEGTIWEAVMAAPRYQLDNLTVILDQNGLQKMDAIESIMGFHSWTERWRAFDWEVSDVDGHDVQAIVNCLQAPHATTKPRLIVAHTVKGKGVSLMENQPDWHWRMPNRKETKVFMRELDLSQEEWDACN